MFYEAFIYVDSSILHWKLVESFELFAWSVSLKLLVCTIRDQSRTSGLHSLTF
jgi:hypothetical protein